MDAVELVVKSMAFEVLYYPRANWIDFVEDANVVDDGMKISWTSGMKVKLPLKKEESSNSKMIFYQPRGTNSDVYKAPSNVPNWRMLQVKWDEPEISQNPNRVNPWQVELINHTHVSYPSFPQQ
ncbi:putative auxin response factor [Medicago truncatula]|uniref:Putative auxin response factor n=1 Tax=Medicago truncatula TaxID=3880 RepID=A0A396HVV5_MEDTR|nr:putative auxin response factor [Medicago truncatula]